MALQDLGKCISLIAGADLSAAQYTFVKLDSSGHIIACGDGQDAIGVLQDKPVSGAVGQVMVGTGVTKIKAGASSTDGGDVGIDANGRAVDAASGDYIMGNFLEAPTAANQIVSMLFQRQSARR